MVVYGLPPSLFSDIFLSLRQLMKGTKKYLMAALLPFIFLWYIGSISLFSHTHIIDGTTIVHSHPGSTDGHEHGAEEALGIELICHYHRDLATDGIFLPKVAFLLLEIVQPEYISPYIPAASTLVRSLRAPPALQ